jgi:UDP-glucose 4-epimerase
MKLFGNDYPTPDGTCLRDYIHVTDLAEAHILAADRLSSGAQRLQLNLGGGEGRTVLQVLKAVEKATGRPVPVTLSPRRPGDAVALYADTTRTKAELGWSPRLSDIDTIVATAWNFHKQKWAVPQAAE